MKLNNKLHKVIAGMSPVKNLLWTVCKGRGYWKITKLMLDSLEFHGDIVIISDFPIKYKNYRNIIIKNMHPWLMKLQIDRINVSKYHKIFFSDSDIIYIKAIPNIQITKDITFAYDPMPVCKSKAHNAHGTTLKYGINAGFFAMDGAKAINTLNIWKNFLKKHDSHHEQAAMNRLISDGTINVDVIKNYAYYPKFTAPSNIVFWHFAGSRKKSRLVREMIAVSKKYNRT